MNSRLGECRVCCILRAYFLVCSRRAELALDNLSISMHLNVGEYSRRGGLEWSGVICSRGQEWNGEESVAVRAMVRTKWIGVGVSWY